jgi:glycerol-3-phosphate dehydrogenase
MFYDELPSRVRALVLGGGIHGVGVLHDLASRGWKDIHLIEKNTIGSGTSSKSTKLIHGGLRYLKRVTDFGLVSDALYERHLLQTVAPDLVRPVEFLFPVWKNLGLPKWQVKIGLTLYDWLAGQFNIKKHTLIDKSEISRRADILDSSKLSSVYSFWDAQTDDLGLVYRVACSAKKLGALITEKMTVIAIRATDDGYKVTVRDVNGVIKEISTLYLINTLGPWANKLLEDSGIAPTHQAINNKGSHLVIRDLGLKNGLFLQSFRGDGRIFFLLPWLGKTLLGTTEKIFDDSLDKVSISSDEISYLLENINVFLKNPLTDNDIESTFAGLRWIPIEKGLSISQMSRSHVIGQISCRRGLLLTVYGGKLTTYRSLSSEVGDIIFKHFGDSVKSQTHLQRFWALSNECDIVPEFSRRFEMFAHSNSL